MIAGKKEPTIPVSDSTKVEINTGVCNRSRQTPEIVHAKTKIRFAGIIACTPFTTPCMKVFKSRSFLEVNCTKATTKAPNEPNTKAGPAEVLPNAAATV